MASNFDRPPTYDELYGLPPSTPLITSQPKVQHVNQYYGQPSQQLQPSQLQPQQQSCVINSSNQSDHHHNNRHNDQCDQVCCCCCLVCIRCIIWG